MDKIYINIVQKYYRNFNWVKIKIIEFGKWTQSSNNIDRSRQRRVARSKNTRKTFLNGASVEKNYRGRILLQRCRKADRRNAAYRGREREIKESEGCDTRTARAQWREYHQDGWHGSNGINIVCCDNYCHVKSFSKCKCKSRRSVSFSRIKTVLISEIL